MKLINKFYLINLILNNDYLSFFDLNIGIITIYPCIILKKNYLDILECLDKEINDNYTFLFLLIFIHEIFNYMKTNINDSIIDSPNNFHKINLKIEKIDMKKTQKMYLNI